MIQTACIVLVKICIGVGLLLALLVLLGIELIMLPVFMLFTEKTQRIVSIYCRVFAYLLYYGITIGNRNTFAIYNKKRERVKTFSELNYPLSSYLMLSNHVSAVDTVIVRMFGISALGIDVKFITKKSVVWMPIVGLAMYMCGFLFIKRDKKSDAQKIKKWLAALNSGEKKAFIIYPEGTRFTQKKYKESLSFCTKQGLPSFNHLLYPRPSGFLLCMQSLNKKKFAKIADLTIIYTEKNQKKESPSFWRSLFLPVKGTFHVLCSIDATDSVADPEKYLIDRFKKKDKIISEFICSLPPSQEGRSGRFSQ